jgi:beta-lactamase class C
LKHHPSACLTLALSVALFAVPPASAQSADASFAEKAEAAFADPIKAYNIPGLVVGITQGGRHSFYATGLASRKDDRAVTPDTLFELGSMSKLFTATLAATAAQQGSLSLDDTVASHVCGGTCRIGDDLTLMDLATHHTGGMPLQVPDDISKAEEMSGWLQTWKPPQPGARSYSNISIGMLGHITAASLGSAYEDALRSKVLSPLGLSNTWITIPETERSRYAFGYDRKTDAPIRVNPGVLDAEAYGVKSTARDMLRFLDAQLGSAPAPEPLPAAMARTREHQYRTDYFIQDMIWEEYAYPVEMEAILAGNGTDFILNPQKADPVAASARAPGTDVILNKTGSTNGFGGYIAMLPGRDLGVIVLANRNFPNEARVRATLALIDALLKP